MPELPETKSVLSLLEVMERVRRTLNERFGSPFWVKAEMNKLNLYSHSGHCYPELLEKSQGKVVAQIRANLWREDYQRINRQFLQVLKEPLREGITILFLARVTFDPVYGLALRILEIDPVFSLGELEREKQESIDRLVKEGIFEKNKTLPLPLLPQRIAVISVESSKGFADFQKMIDDNPWGYCFFYMLFPSLLQGDKVAESVGAALEKIRRVRSHFDAVAIIRGGGGDVGLAGYNRYELARHIALFPLPVITGIGHATNETVAELVAWRNGITPTEVATFLIQQFHNVSVPVREAQQLFVRESRQLLTASRETLTSQALDLQEATRRFLAHSSRYLVQQASRLRGFSGFILRANRESLGRNAGILRGEVSRLISGHHERILTHSARLIQSGTHRILSHQNALSSLIRQVELLDPRRILARGYSITRMNGKVIRNSEEVKEGNVIETTLYKGFIKSLVQKYPKKSSS